MKRIDGRHHLLAASIGLALAACSSSDSGNPSGPGSTQPNNSAELSISLMDAPVDNAVEVNLEITGLFIKPEDGPAEELPLTETPFETDLLTLTDENPALLVENALIEAGAYEWLRLEVNAVIDGSTDDSYVVNDVNEWKELFVPSGRVQLVGGFEVVANESVEFLFDWDLRSGLVLPPGLGGIGTDVYLLKPTIRVLDTNFRGRLSGTISMDTVMAPDNECDADSEPGEYDVGNAVYIFAGTGVTPDDIDDEGDTAPIATVDAELSDDSTVYEYSTVLDEGDYTVAFTCQAANDDPEANDTGNEMEEDDTVAFVATADITIIGDAEDPDVEVDF